LRFAASEQKLISVLTQRRTTGLVSNRINTNASMDFVASPQMTVCDSPQKHRAGFAIPPIAATSQMGQCAFTQGRNCDSSHRRKRVLANRRKCV
jgi:hypothetical protein